MKFIKDTKIVLIISLILFLQTSSFCEEENTHEEFKKLILDHVKIEAAFLGDYSQDIIKYIPEWDMYRCRFVMIGMDEACANQYLYKVYDYELKLVLTAGYYDSIYISENYIFGIQAIP